MNNMNYNYRAPLIETPYARSPHQTMVLQTMVAQTITDIFDMLTQDEDDTELFRDQGYRLLRSYLSTTIDEADSVFGWHLEVEDCGSTSLIDIGNQRWWVVGTHKTSALNPIINECYRRLNNRSALAVLTALHEGIQGKSGLEVSDVLRNSLYTLRPADLFLDPTYRLQQQQHSAAWVWPALSPT